MELFSHPAFQAFVAGLLSWASISMGALVILTRENFSRRTMDIMLGMAGGMMLGATFWSLLTPALQMSEHLGKLSFAPPLLGLLLGAAFLRGFDFVLPHLHGMSNTTEGMHTAWRRSILLVTAMALHHIPEGLAVGVGYGAAGAAGSAMTLSAAMVLTASIMLQGIPEGLIVSLALRAEGLSARKACLLGILTGCTAPLGAVPGALAAGLTAQILPVALGFAAGAMLYIIVEDVIPESQASGHGNEATLAVIGGVIMVMCMDSLF